MKLLIVLTVVAVLVLSQDDFATWLRRYQSHRDYMHLSSEEKLLFAELVLAADNDELDEFIDRAGFLNVLKLMHHMDGDDAQHFERYLATLEGWYYHSLPPQEQQTMDHLMQAVENNTVQQFVDEEGYGKILGLLSYMDPHHAEDVARLLEASLAQLPARRSASKREREEPEHERQHWDDFLHLLHEMHSGYYRQLPDQELGTLDNLIVAVQTRTVHQFVEEEGYGNILGLLGYLDPHHSDEVLRFLEVSEVPL
nr:hypothetical protein BaRGS_009005 [Batillaria attramentaria]